MTNQCQTGCGRPTTAVLCRPCADALADALAQLAAWSKPPALLFNDDGSARLLPRGKHGSLPSSVFDTASGVASLGGTKAYAAELDTVRARQTRRGEQAGPRPAPGPKVHWPFAPVKDSAILDWGEKPPPSRLDSVSRHLTSAVQHWVALLAQGDVVAPHVIVTGNALARACTWLLWHVHDITVHAQAADAHRDFTRAAHDIGKLVDRPEDRVYVGPCWHVGPSEVECPADLFAKPGAANVQCVACGHVVGVAARRLWLEDHYEEMDFPAADVCRVLATIGLSVSLSQVTVWATRDALVGGVKRKPLLAVGRVNVGGHSRPTYRVGDVKALAVKAAQDPRAARRAERASA